MRITFVMPTLEVSGGAKIIVGHAERLAASGHEVLFVAPRPHQLTIKQRIKKTLGRDIIVPDPKSANIRNSSVRTHLPRHFLKIVEDDVPSADVIIASWWETAEWIKDFSLSKGAKVHFIQHFEGFAPMPFERVQAVWKLPLFKITIAQWLVDLGRERFGIDSMALVPNAIDDEFRDPRIRLKSDPPRVGFLFHTAEFKDYSTTRAAVIRLRQLRSDIRLVSFGAMIPAPGDLPEGTKYYHLPNRAQIASIYQSCDVWLSTSVTEGFNLPPLEAMACGTPAVCGKTGRPSEIIENGLNGYLVNSGDTEGFVEALQAVLNLSNSNWTHMSEAAKAAVAHPTWNESSALFEAALGQALDSRCTGTNM